MVLDDTILSSSPGATDNRASSPTRAPRRRRAVVLLVVVLAVVALLVALPNLAGRSAPGEADADSSLELDHELGLEGGLSALGEEPEAEETGGGLELGGGWIGEPEPGQAGEPEVGPEGQGEPDGPEPEPPVEPVPATLTASPDPVQLTPGVYGGSFTVGNLGDDALTWTALSKPSVTLSDTGGQLGGKSSTIVAFSIDESTLASGAFSFKIKVTGNGGTTYVDVHGFKPFDELVFKP